MKLWTSLLSSEGLSSHVLIIQKNKEKNKRIFPFSENPGRKVEGGQVCGEEVEKGETVEEKRRKTGEGKRGEDGEGGDMNRSIHGVEKLSPLMNTAVEKCAALLARRKSLCYNGSMETADFSRLSALCEREREKFEILCSTLSEYNARYNLTAVTEPEEVFVKHILDSLAGESFFPEGARVAEVGSGGGFPSLPLAIVRPDLRFTLIESTGKKCDYLRVACARLGVSAEVVNVRAEDAARGELREKADVCCARAVARLDTLAEYCLPLVKKGGLFLAYKGAEDETSLAARAIFLLGGGNPRCVRYELPGGAGKRTLVLVRKERETPAKYPRGQGKERKEPL